MKKEKRIPKKNIEENRIITHDTKILKTVELIEEIEEKNKALDQIEKFIEEESKIPPKYPMNKEIDLNIEEENEDKKELNDKELELDNKDIVQEFNFQETNKEIKEIEEITPNYSRLEQKLNKDSAILDNENKTEEIKNTDEHVIKNEEDLTSLEDNFETNEKNIKPKIEKQVISQKKNILDSFYFGSKERIITFVIVAILFLGSSIGFLNKSIHFFQEKNINYEEKYNLDYRVNLKENNFYDKPYLEKNMTYISSLIKDVDITYTYDFQINNEYNLKFNYYTYAILTISDSYNNTYLTKEYRLSEPKELNIIDSKSTNITEKVKIDYDYYNRLASEFKQTYGVSTNSTLTIYLKIDKSNEDKNIDIEFKESKPFSLTIPLSEKSVNINMDYQAENSSNEILSKSKLEIINKRYLAISICFLTLSLITIILMIRFTIKINIKKSKYDKMVEKILKEYDRLIVNTKSKPNQKSKEVIKVSEFNELLDVRDTIQMPIMFYEVTKHQKCHFYIQKDYMLYILTIKAIDLDEKN